MTVISEKTKQVWKVDVPIDDEWHDVETGKMLHVGQQDERTVTLWFENVRMLRGRLRVFGTGRQIPDGVQYVGTVQVPRGLVWHLYRDVRLSDVS